MAEGDRVFPILNRRTPLLDRLEDGKGSEFTDQAAKELVAIRDADEEDAIELMETFSERFRESVADEMGVDPDDINPELVEEFMSFVFFEGEFVSEEDNEDSNPLQNLQSNDQEEE